MSIGSGLTRLELRDRAEQGMEMQVSAALDAVYRHSTDSPGRHV